MTLAIGSFSYNNVLYERYLDVTDPLDPVVKLFVIGHPQLSHVSEANRGEVDGQLFPQPYGQQCYTDLSDPFHTQYFYRIYSEADSPFATVLTTVEGCPSVICDLIIGTITTTDETAINAKNGAMSAVVTTSNGPFKCSIDNITYGPPNTCSFTGLRPGAYTLYVYDAEACVAQTNFVIHAYAAVQGCTDPQSSNYNPSAQVNDGSCVYPIPSDNAENLENLYASPDQFRLVYNRTTWEIAEPKGWDKITITLKRDDTYHGVNYIFSEGDFKLAFDDPAGQQLLKEAYDTDGNDAIMQFQFGYDNFGVFIPYFDGFVDFNTYEIQEFITACGVKRKIFSDLLQTRADTQVRLKDGAIQLHLHTKLIREAIVVNEAAFIGDTTIVNNPPIDDPYTGDTDAHYYVLLDFAGASQNDLRSTAQPMGIYIDNPVDFSNYVFKSDGGGTYQFNLDFVISTHINLEQTSVCFTSPRHGYWSFKFYIFINGAPNTYLLPITIDGHPGNAGFTNSRTNDLTIRLSGYSQSIVLNSGDEVYIFGDYLCQSRGCYKDSAIQMSRISETLNIFGDTKAPASSTSAFLAFETAQAVLTYVTDGQLANGTGQVLTAKAKLVSSLLGRTDIGYGADGCAALIAYSNGYQIRGFSIANRPIFISFTDFMQGLNALYCIGLGYEVDTLGNYYARIERFDYFYQDVEILLFDNVSEYVEDVDLTMIFNELEFGYAKYTNNLPSSNNTLDEFCTDHDYLTPIQSHKLKLTQVCKQIASGYAIELTRRQYYATTPNDSWTYDDDNFIIAAVREGTGYKSETNENYTVSGVIGPDSVYNVRLAISRMVDRWSKIINSGLAYKKPSAEIINTYVAYNGDLTSQLITPDSCDSEQQFTESSSLTLGEVGNFEKTFLPAKITFKKRISWQTLSFLIRCFQNQDTNGRNNGYISVVDPDGNTQQGYLMELQYNPESELASFTLRKKYVDSNVPFDCSPYTAYDWHNFETPPGVAIETEQCTFNNFA